MPIGKIINAVLAFDGTSAVREVQSELDSGTDALSILNEGLIAAMDEVGNRYHSGVFFVPEMMMAARAMKKGMALLRPHLENAGNASKGCIVIGTVLGDQHDIGKNLVAMMLECAGFKVVDLGTDVPGEKFVKAARQNRADLIALSALITTTTTSMRAAVLEIRSQNRSTKTIVGGAPVTQAFADEIGADGYSPDATGAVEVAHRLICAD